MTLSEYPRFTRSESSRCFISQLPPEHLSDPHLCLQVVIKEEDALSCHADELRNVAAQAASKSSKWILFFDDDDIAHPHLIASHLQTALGLSYATSSSIKKDILAQKHFKLNTQEPRPTRGRSKLISYQHSLALEPYVVDNRNVDVVVGCYLKVPADQLHGVSEFLF